MPIFPIKIGNIGYESCVEWNIYRDWDYKIWPKILIRDMYALISSLIITISAWENLQLVVNILETRTRWLYLISTTCIYHLFVVRLI